jgi:CubicO group peptidase (beta-lactamase class C family)
LKSTLYSLGFTLSLVVGCNAALENKSQHEFTQALPAFESTLQPFTFSDSSSDYDAVKNYFEKKLVTRNFNGGILVAKGNSIIYEKYVGYTDLRTKDNAIDAESPMHIASVSKNFAATAILKLVQEGKLQLTDPLTNFFPNFPYEGITVQMLLSHRSGLPDYMHFLDNAGWDRNKQATNQDVLNSLYTLHPNVEFKAGTRFTYSNTNFVLAALIIEKLSGLPYPEYMKKTFFEPLQMNDTYIADLNDLSTVTPSFEANGRYWKPDFLEGTYGDKNVYTTPRDLLKWTLALKHDQLIDQSMLDAAFTPYSNERPGVHNYGFGWRLLMLKNGKKIVYHNGRWHGTNAALAMLPEEDVTIIIIGNKFNSNIYNAARNSYDIFGDYLHGGTVNEDEEPVVRVHHHHYVKKSLAKRRSVKKAVAKKSPAGRHYTSSSGKVVAKRK